MLKTNLVILISIVVLLQHTICLQSTPMNHNPPGNEEEETILQHKIHHHDWKRIEIMDPVGLYTLEWWVKSKEIFFRATVNTQGFIGLGFSKKSGLMAGSDLVLLWVDDRTGKPNILDCHGDLTSNSAAPIQDDTQNYNIIDGFQNSTHTQIEFSRSLETCDPHDLPIGSETLKVLWSFGKTDPIHGNLNSHGHNRGVKSLFLLGPLFKRPSPPLLDFFDIKQWDVTVKNVAVENNVNSLYWCKIISAPPLNEKHHIIGYEPLLTKEINTKKPLVHHMILFECSTSSYSNSNSASWDVWVKSNGSVCNSNLVTPRDWDSCITPVAVWSIGSTGQFLPSHVGIPIGGGSHSAKYYMLEVHYDNIYSRKLFDNSGFRIHYTKNLRQNDAGIMISGISASDTLIIPPGQKLYRNVGICAPTCTSALFPKSGIKIISGALHSHSAGRKLKLRHIRDGKELERIIEDDNYDYNYQQVRQLENETTILPGDYIITDCAYETIERKRPTFGGFSMKQEICRSFLTYYPKIDLAGCYSMTPVQEFFATFGVYKFRSLNMTDVENLFLYNGNILDLLPSKVYETDTFNNTVSDVKEKADEYYQQSLLNKLIISDPVEFHDRTFMNHLMILPWSEQLFTRRVEQNIINGKHMTFCKISNESASIPSEIICYPKYTPYIKLSSTCPYHQLLLESSTLTATAISINCVTEKILLVLISLTLISVNFNSEIFLSHII
ncbi:MOXD1 homolog 1 [Condylostylus longicornis]|uniref:MOXD1 homolog 1 n=1 Tax=Condylostylus longicornis TaxID=2530218 RepID=UPI00244E342F|nr:MOXD1 homolog 1 [Condylostylus longicornis]